VIFASPSVWLRATQEKPSSGPVEWAPRSEPRPQGAGPRRRQHFTERFYRQLMNTFGLIAHYDRMGFWTDYFTTTAGKIEFIEQAIQWPFYANQYAINFLLAY
jgi:hypothetical protein